MSSGIAKLGVRQTGACHFDSGCEGMVVVKVLELPYNLANTSPWAWCRAEKMHFSGFLCSVTCNTLASGNKAIGLIIDYYRTEPGEV